MKCGSTSYQLQWHLLFVRPCSSWRATLPHSYNELMGVHAHARIRSGRHVTTLSPTIRPLRVYTATPAPSSRSMHPCTYVRALEPAPPRPRPANTSSSLVGRPVRQSVRRHSPAAHSDQSSHTTGWQDLFHGGTVQCAAEHVQTSTGRWCWAAGVLS